MIKLETLEQLGVDTKEGLGRVLNNESLYLKLFQKAISDSKFDELKEKIESKDYTSAFEISHSLKGVLGNLSITPMYKVVFELTELLRDRKEVDCSALINELLELRDKFINITK